MENPKEIIYSILKDSASKLGQNTAEFKVERPKDKSNGDFASNIALFMFKGLKKDYKTPLELAEKLAKDTKKHALFEKVEAVKPGFINFYLSKEYLTSQVLRIIEEGSFYGSSASNKGKKASVEFVSANPTGPLHIGNARGGPLGDTIANVLEKTGYKVTREYLHNDVGGQVERLGESIYYELHPDQKSPTYVTPYQGQYVKELALMVEETLNSHEDQTEEELMEDMGEVAVGILFEEIKKDLKDMGITYDSYRKESELRLEIPKVLPKLQKYLKEKEGALWFAPNDEFLKDRETVVRKSDGEYTYFASDIVYHDEKMSKNDLSLDVLGANHYGHVSRVQAVIKALGYDVSKFKAILYQFVRIRRGNDIVNMSKRAGNFITAREVLDEVGKDAFRFFLLSPRAETHMDFDLELAKQKSSDNPVYYIQYAHTRISSIFKKAEIKSYDKSDLSLLKEEEELDLIRSLTTFPYLVEDISKNYEVNALTTYALELAILFHKFYEKVKVISDNSDLTNARLALLKATQITLKNTLDLLGISAPDKM
jgi:arginyl-tRNA synthetase